MSTLSSSDLFARARRVIPGGVNSPVRAFGAVGGEPVYIVGGRGAVMETADGRELVDFCGSWGPLLFGHAREEIVEAVCRAAREGTSFGANTPREVLFAETLCELAPDLEKVRLVNSGTEAAMSALRLARGFTGRRKILKFDGCYHGHADYLLVSAGSGLLTGGISSSEGVLPATAADVLVVPYNDLEAVRAVVREHGGELAAIVVEPVAGNMGLAAPLPGFLKGLRAAADACGALLVFDEVITGFRFGPTTFGTTAGVRADLICLGKIIGGGLPIGAFGGRADVMDRLAPLGGVYQAGTLSGNPVAVAAGQAMLDLIRAENPYPALAKGGLRLAQGLNAAAGAAGAAMHTAFLGGVFTPFFTRDAVHDLASAKRSDTAAHAAFFRGMLARGYYLPPSQFEVAFVSAAHEDAHIDGFIAAARDTLAAGR